MKQYIIIFILILLFSCGSKNHTAIKEELNSSYSMALQEQINLSNKIQQSISKGDFASFKSDVDSSLNNFQVALVQVSVIKVDQSQEKYKESVITALNSFKSVAEIGKEFNDLTVNSTEQEYNDLISRFNNLVNEKIPADIANVTSAK